MSFNDNDKHYHFLRKMNHMPWYDFLKPTPLVPNHLLTRFNDERTWNEIFSKVDLFDYERELGRITNKCNSNNFCIYIKPYLEFDSQKNHYSQKRFFRAMVGNSSKKENLRINPFKLRLQMLDEKKNMYSAYDIIKYWSPEIDPKDESDKILKPYEFLILGLVCYPFDSNSGKRPYEILCHSRFDSTGSVKCPIYY